jgi:hypothetical protein
MCDTWQLRYWHINSKWRDLVLRFRCLQTFAHSVNDLLHYLLFQVKLHAMKSGIASYNGKNV